MKKATPENKYQALKGVIHFQNNDTVNENKSDKGFKVRHLIKMINTSFQQFGIFQEFLSVDETIVKYYGHHSLKHSFMGSRSDLEQIMGSL